MLFPIHAPISQLFLKAWAVDTRVHRCFFLASHPHLEYSKQLGFFSSCQRLGRYASRPKNSMDGPPYLSRATIRPSPRLLVYSLGLGHVAFQTLAPRKCSETIFMVDVCNHLPSIFWVQPKDRGRRNELARDCLSFRSSAYYFSYARNPGRAKSLPAKVLQVLCPILHCSWPCNLAFHAPKRMDKATLFIDR